MRFTRAFRLLTLAAAAAGAASAALAAGVTSEQAQTAARNWVSRSPARMTARFASSSVAGVQTSEDAAGRTLCHVVNLAGGGYVFPQLDRQCLHGTLRKPAFHNKVRPQSQSAQDGHDKSEDRSALSDLKRSDQYGCLSCYGIKDLLCTFRHGGHIVRRGVGLDAAFSFR